MMSRIALIVAIVALSASVYAASSNLTLEFNYTYFYDQVVSLNLSGAAPVDWKENQTEGDYYELVTNAWIFEPTTNETGTRFSTMRVTFGEGCQDAFNVSALKMIMYPFGYPAVSPNLSAQFQDLPSFAQEVSMATFNGTDHFSKNYSAGEVFLGWRCCMQVGILPKTGEYTVIENNLTTCIITVEAFGPTVLVSSLKLFYGTLLLILVPALLTIIAHFIMLCAQRNATEKSEASFKRANCECRLFWLVWVVSFGIYIGVVMVPLY